MTILVSLGRDCQAAHQIDRLRGPGRPAQFFDWLITPQQGLLRLLGEDFAGFLDDDRIVVEGSHDGHHRVVDRPSTVELLHDFPLAAPVAAELDRVRAKYAHLAARFRALDAARCLFVRQVEPEQYREDHARALRAALAGYFGAEIRLLVVSDVFVAARWSIPGVVTAPVRQPDPYVWTGSDAAWMAAFRTAGISAR